MSERDKEEGTDGSKRGFRERKRLESKEGNVKFISQHLLGGKFFAVKYLLLSTFLSFAVVETCWMLW